MTRIVFGKCHVRGKESSVSFQKQDVAIYAYVGKAYWNIEEETEGLISRKLDKSGLRKISLGSLDRQSCPIAQYDLLGRLLKNNFYICRKSGNIYQKVYQNSNVGFFNLGPWTQKDQF